MKRGGAWWAWLTFFLGAMLISSCRLIATFEFSMRMKRGEYSFEAYRVVFASSQFQQTFTYSVVAAIFTILLGILIVVPTAYWVRLRMPHLRPVIEFITLLPLVIPAIVIVFGYIRMYGTNSWLPFLGTTMGTNVLLVIGYAVLALPYMYRAVDTGLRTIDVKTLTEAAQIMGAGWPTIIGRVILPNVLIAVLVRRVPDLRDRARRIHASPRCSTGPPSARTCRTSAPTAPMNPRRSRSSPSC